MSPHIPMSAGAVSRDQWVTDLHWHTGWSPEDIACRMSVYIYGERDKDGETGSEGVSESVIASDIMRVREK